MKSAFIHGDFEHVNRLMQSAGFLQVSLYLDDWPSYSAAIMYKNRKGERLDVRSTKMGPECYEVRSGVDCMYLDGTKEKYGDVLQIVSGLRQDVLPDHWHFLR